VRSGVLRVVKCVTSYLALQPCGLLHTKQVCGKFIAVHGESPQTEPTGPSEPCVSGSFFLPAFHNYVIAVGCPKCSTSPINPAGTTAVLECALVSTNVPTRNCVASSVFRRHVFVATLRDRWQRCAVVEFKRGRALLKAAIGLRWLSVAGVRRKLNKNETGIIVH